MKSVFVENTNIITSLGSTTAENARNIVHGKCGLKITDNQELSPVALPLSQIDDSSISFDNLAFQDLTRFEKLLVLSVKDAIRNSSVDISSDDTVIILSTTKGNIDLLSNDNSGSFAEERLYLWKSAEILGRYFENPNKVITVCNACVSGVLALNAAQLLITSGKYKNAIVAGGDVLSEFIISGFQSFQSLSESPCKPYDAKRDGLSLGEGFGTIILSSRKNEIEVCGGASSNDANHISGPSRTGDGLFYAIEGALKQSGMDAADIDFISAHGTATPYNDEMEAKAFTLSGLNKVPLNSFKGYIGHTLGAAGIIEAALTVDAMKNNILFGTLGYEEHGVSKDLNIVSRSEANHEFSFALKTASGFGGCNAAIVFKKNDNE